MASYLDFSVDQSAWTADLKTKSKEALANYFNVKNPDGTLDISDGPLLIELWQKKNASMIKAWYRDALKYKESLDNVDMDLDEE